MSTTKTNHCKSYPSDMTDDEWVLWEKVLPKRSIKKNIQKRFFQLLTIQNNYDDEQPVLEELKETLLSKIAKVGG